MADTEIWTASEGLFIPLDVFKHNIVRYLTHSTHQAAFRIACKAFMNLLTLPCRVLTFQRVKDAQKLSKTVQIFKQIRAHRFKKAETFLGLFQAMTVQNCSVKAVDLSNCKIGRKFFGELVEVMKQCPSLRSLDLMQTKLRPQKAVFLAELLRANTPLTQLDLRYNKLELSGHQTIADALQFNTTLKTLHLTGVVRRFAQPNYLEDILAKNKSLTSLDLTYSFDKSAVTMPLCRGLLRNNTLKTLDTGVFDITKESVSLLKEALMKNTALEELDLGDLGTRSVPVNERPVDHFIELLSALNTNSTLKKLEFNTDIAEFHAEFFKALAAPNCPIRSVNHGSYQHLLQLDSVIALGSALKVNVTLVEMNLLLARATLAALADALSTNTSIRRLNIYSFAFNQDDIDRLSSALMTNTEIRELTLSQASYAEGAKEKKIDCGPLLKCLAARPTIMSLVCLDNIAPKAESTAHGLLELLESNNLITIRFYWIDDRETFWEIVTKELCARPHLGTKVLPVVKMLHRPLISTLKQAWASYGQENHYLHLFDPSK